MEMFRFCELRKNLKETTLFLVFHLLSFLVVNCSQILQENPVAIRKIELLRLEIISAISLGSFGEVVKNNNNNKNAKTRIPSFPWKFLTSMVQCKKPMECPNLCMKQSGSVTLLCSPAPCEGFAGAQSSAAAAAGGGEDAGNLNFGEGP